MLWPTRIASNNPRSVRKPERLAAKASKCAEAPCMGCLAVTGKVHREDVL
jgi:hypothetical protein